MPGKQGAIAVQPGSVLKASSILYLFPLAWWEAFCLAYSQLSSAA